MAIRNFAEERKISCKQPCKPTSDPSNNSLINHHYTQSKVGSESTFGFAQDVIDKINNALHTYAMAYINVKKFKLINDIFGFNMGDKLIEIITKIISENLEYDETFLRYVDDRFYILLKFYSSEEISQRLNDIFQKIKCSFCSELGRNYNIILQAGVYVVQNSDMNFYELCSKANYALKDEQISKILNVVIYDEKIKDTLYREQKIENKMHFAMKNNDFELFLQPKYDLDTENIVGGEALVRWFDSDDNNRLISPNDFIHIFERDGFITTLDIYMLDKACQSIKIWIDSGAVPVPISVNFSKLHLLNNNFAKDVKKILDKYNIPPKYIEIELTENALFEDSDMLMSTLNELHKDGIMVSVDDFGKGYSSLGMLKNFPFDVIKLDKSFFDDCVDFQKGQIIISSVIKMAKSIGMKTLSEGIEVKEHIEMLKTFECDMVQGFYYSKPMPVNEFTKLLKKETFSK